MRTTIFRHAVACVAMSAAVVLIGAGVASAHLDPDPIAMQAGSTATVAFTVEHGCNDSPTTDVQFQIPTGVTAVAPVDKTGWTATVTGNVVEFKGGPLAADQKDHFDITFTAPAQPGEIHFPTIQTCEQGNIGWIEIPVDGAAEPDNPAPTIKVTQGPPTAAELTPIPDAPETTATSVAGGTAAPLSTTVAAVPPAKDSGNTAVIVVVVALATVLIGGAMLRARRHNSTAESAPKS